MFSLYIKMKFKKKSSLLESTVDFETHRENNAKKEK